MKKDLFKLSLIFGTLTLMLGLVFGSAVNADDIQELQINDGNMKSENMCPIINITVQEAWDLLTDTGNGIQYPIDVRRTDEWNQGFVDTPYPENTHYYFLDWLKADNGTDFADKYNGTEVIMYCKGGYRSLVASYIVCLESPFTGTIYNMLGGITAWINAGYPIRNNTKPLAPTISGPTHARAGEEYEYEFSTTDDEGDAVYYWVLWGDGCPAVEWIGPYTSGEIVKLNHTFENQGTYNITAKAKDFYGNESDIGSLEVTMPKNKELAIRPLLQLLERFSNIYRILQNLLGI
jgi:rhodanese-related sulfurtransferase